MQSTAPQPSLPTTSIGFAAWHPAARFGSCSLPPCCCSTPAPLFEERSTIQWDAADYHYSAQKYFAGQIRSGQLPHWSPYPYSGMPFLADIQVGAWYPLNWPFFLMGITPRAIEWEIALHCLVAFSGAWLLALELTGDSVAALFAGALYAFSGFLRGHSSHVGMFQCASLLPWLLWTGIAALRRWRWLPAVAAIAAGVDPGGHFQTALYALAAFGLFLVAYGLQTRVAPWRIAAVLGCTVALALGLTAIQISARPRAHPRIQPRDRRFRPRHQLHPGAGRAR